MIMAELLREECLVGQWAPCRAQLLIGLATRAPHCKPTSGRFLRSNR